MIERVNVSKLSYSIVAIAAITLITSIAVFFAARAAWENWTLYAIVFSSLMLFGGVCFWPWSVKRIRPVGIGLILGLLVAAAEFWIYKVVQ
jgi:hypothetical protein